MSKNKFVDQVSKVMQDRPSVMNAKGFKELEKKMREADSAVTTAINDMKENKAMMNAYGKEAILNFNNFKNVIDATKDCFKTLPFISSHSDLLETYKKMGERVEKVSGDSTLLNQAKQLEKNYNKKKAERAAGSIDKIELKGYKNTLKSELKENILTDSVSIVCKNFVSGTNNILACAKEALHTIRHGDKAARNQIVKNMSTLILAATMVLGDVIPAVAVATGQAVAREVGSFANRVKNQTNAMVEKYVKPVLNAVGNAITNAIKAVDKFAKDLRTKGLDRVDQDVEKGIDKLHKGLGEGLNKFKGVAKGIINALKPQQQGQAPEVRL